MKGNVRVKISSQFNLKNEPMPEAVTSLTNKSIANVNQIRAEIDDAISPIASPALVTSSEYAAK
jgi:hypothetical protein